MAVDDDGGHTRYARQCDERVIAPVTTDDLVAAPDFFTVRDVLAEATVEHDHRLLARVDVGGELRAGLEANDRRDRALAPRTRRHGDELQAIDEERHPRRVVLDASEEILRGREVEVEEARDAVGEAAILAAARRAREEARAKISAWPRGGEDAERGDRVLRRAQLRVAHAGGVQRVVVPRDRGRETAFEQVLELDGIGHDTRIIPHTRGMCPRGVRSTALRASSLLFGLFLVGCRSRHLEGTAAAAGVVEAGPAPVTVAAPTDAGPACAPPDPSKIAAFAVDTSALHAPVPPIEGVASLDGFYAKLLRLARGAEGTVRIGIYGDSNLTSDHLSGHVRRVLQQRFGDAGHGFVGLARPWGWYVHEDVWHTGSWPLFKQIASTTDVVPGNRYGFANIAAESRKAGAWAEVGTSDAGPVGGRASRFDLHFLAQPHGGSFDVLLDGKVVRSVETAAESIGPGYDLVETTDAAHRVRVRLRGDGPVRLFGATLERGTSGIVVDSLGVGAMNYQRFVLGEPALRRAQLAHRGYDLVLIWLGLNVMWVEPNRAWATEAIASLREAIPDVPVLVVGPPDSVKMGEGKSDPRIVAVVKQLREVAGASHAAFWDFRAAMGGDAAYLDFMKRGLAANDRAHLSKQGNAVMGQRLLAALFEGLAEFRGAHPGCE